jgi:hypothetical protein
MHRAIRNVVSELTTPPLPSGSPIATRVPEGSASSSSDVKYIVVSPTVSVGRPLMTTSALIPVASGSLDESVEIGEQVRRAWSDQAVLAELIGSGPCHRAITANITDHRLADLLEDLVNLRAAHDGDDLYVASEFAYWNAVRLLSAAYGLLMVTTPSYFRLPRPTLSADEEGGLRCRWVGHQREIRINFAGRPELRSYIYYEQEPVYALEELTADNAAARLRWLLEE